MKNFLSDEIPCEAPCSCNHARDEHSRQRPYRCLGLDSYGVPCDCPSYEPDPNVLADLAEDAD